VGVVVSVGVDVGVSVTVAVSVAVAVAVPRNPRKGGRVRGNVQPARNANRAKEVRMLLKRNVLPADIDSIIHESAEAALTELKAVHWGHRPPLRFPILRS
jgi:hypothetical protein